MTDAQVTTVTSDIVTRSPDTALEIRNLLTKLFNKRGG
jgi:hypothetical protein